MKKSNILWSLLALLFTTFAFTSCSDDDDNAFDDNGTTVQLPNKRVFILNEGMYGANNSNISFYAPNGEIEPISNLYSKQNNANLGDTGQDLIVYDGYLYLSVNGSKYLQKLNSAGVVLKTVYFTEADGSPRQLVAEDGFIYISMYSGKVYKYDTELNKVGEVTVAANPEGLAIDDDVLLCVNSGWGAGNTMSVIDLKTFTVSNTLEIGYNPQSVVADDGYAYVSYLSYPADYSSSYTPLEKINIATGNREPLGNGSKMAEYDDVLYICVNDANYNTGNTAKSFVTYNMKTGKMTKSSFLKNAPEDVTTENNQSVYAFAIDPSNGDFYIGLSSYSTSSYVYRFKKDGSYIGSFTSGGINPNHIVFM